MRILFCLLAEGKPLSNTNIGSPWPLGSTITTRGVNFSIAAPKAEKIELLIFPNASAENPVEIFELNEENKSGNYWHIEIEGIGEGCCYGYKAYHENSKKDYKNDSQRVLIDPCARAITGWDIYQRGAYINGTANTNQCLKGVVCERNHFDFTSHPRPRHKLNKSIIYELHVQSFTCKDESEVLPQNRGKFLGLIEKIPYLKELGITAIELLPVYIFDPYDSPQGKRNFWGYSPLNWFTPHHEYTVGKNGLTARQEFREMVSAFHDVDIEILIDVVYNHTTEGNEHGPMLSWKGFADEIYYHKDNNSKYLDVTGCGNTIAANRPIVQQLILESMRCWAIELGVDGFRFDLGIALSRGENLEALKSPPLFKAIEADPILSDLKLISEPWDCGGLYEIGNFPSERISTWNGCFRDDLRSFWKGDQNTTWKLKDRLNGSPDLFENTQNCISRSVNFITSHDGFTLHDLVSYNRKHNFANGESNRDGENHNQNWNHGIEGPCSRDEVKKLRARQQRNFLASLLLSPGVPMISMGDEVGRSQGGNNNTWCQDSPLGWMIWSKENCDYDLLDFIKKLICIRKQYPSIFSPSNPHPERINGKILKKESLFIQWHGVQLEKPDFSSWSHSLSFSVNQVSGHPIMWMALNACNKPLKFQIPDPASHWKVLINTANTNKEAFSSKPINWNNPTIDLKDHSVVVLMNNEIVHN